MLSCQLREDHKPAPGSLKQTHQSSVVYYLWALSPKAQHGVNLKLNLSCIIYPYYKREEGTESWNMRH